MINVLLSDLFVIVTQEKGIEDVREDRRTHVKKENAIIEDVPLTEDGRDFPESKFGKNKSLR